MAEATVPRPRRPAAIVPAEEQRDSAAMPNDMRLRPELMAVWIAFVAGAVVLVLFGTVQVGAGNWIFGDRAVRAIWSRFPGYLANQGFSASVITLILAALALVCLGSALLLWLALALRDESAARDEPAVARE